VTWRVPLIEVAYVEEEKEVVNSIFEKSGVVCISNRPFKGKNVIQINPLGGAKIVCGG
jgi:hypothetical protein